MMILRISSAPNPIGTRGWRQRDEGDRHSAAEGDTPGHRREHSDVPAGEQQRRGPHQATWAIAELVNVKGDEQRERCERQDEQAQAGDRARTALG